MVVVNTENIPGQNYQVISLVTGCCILSKNIFKDFGQGVRNIVGGEMGAYTQMLNEAKDRAIHNMIEAAMQMGADGIVNVRFSSSSIVQGGAEILVAGTAVKFV
jgi:uncharacterized protein YbjQ (UPF0145 family)